MNLGYEAYLIIGSVALLVSLLTLFSGFGLGTLLMPAFALFFPLSVAIAATAIVHLANNLFKLGILWKSIAWNIALKFAVPAAFAAFFGAMLLSYSERLEPILVYSMGNRVCQITVTKLLISVLIFVFALLELVPSLEGKITFTKKQLPLGATLSGFFGGLSGHQGALRSAMLIKFGLQKQTFIATGVFCAVFVDLSRLTAYGWNFFSAHIDRVTEMGGLELVLFASVTAFSGAFLGTRLMKKVTMRTIQRLVGAMLLLLASALATGVV